nr:MAG TPA: STRUCTURAL MAINTENANCE OF CHROMOSOMES PROTEIN [Caudoviricetes sp.]
MSMKISKLEIENVKRVKAVSLEPTQNGLTVIGGRNNQGKTSVLDSIAWALGGDKFKPTSARRDGSVVPPYLHVEMDNGLVVERKGENSSLKVIDPAGRKGGQQLLNEFVEQFALDLPRFMEQSAKEKANVLLRIIGVEEQLKKLDYDESTTFNRRREVGRIALQKQKYAEELPLYPDVPKEPISASELILRQQDILARNGENQRLRSEYASMVKRHDELLEKLRATQAEFDDLTAKIAISTKTVEELVDESTDEIRESLLNIEKINTKVRANGERERAEIEAEQYKKDYDALTAEIEDLRAARTKLLDNADLPLPGLSVVDGELTYNGVKWDCMSGSDQLKTATAIVRRLNPKCGFVLLDKLEQMDIDTLREFGQWLESEGLQAIATRVSTGDECSIIIEDGTAVAAAVTEKSSATPKNEIKWKAGEF